MIFLDSYLSTPICDEAKKKISMELNNYLLPIRFAYQGGIVYSKITEVKKIVSNELKNSKPNEISFFSEPVMINNLIVKGVIEYHLRNGKKYKDLELLAEKVACPDIIALYNYYKTKGINIKYIDVDNNGLVKFDDLKNKLSKKTILVSITHINPILGIVQKIDKISNIVKSYDRNIMINIEAELSFLKYEIDVNLIDFLVFSGHKIYGPVIGGLYVKKGSKYLQTILGRGINNFEKGFMNIPYILGLGESIKYYKNNLVKDKEYIIELVNYFKSEMKNNIEDIEFLSNDIKDEQNDFSSLMVYFKYVEGEALFLDLSLNDIITATSSACANEKLKADYVILAIGREYEVAHGTLRFSLNKFNTKIEIDLVIEQLKKSVKRLRCISSFDNNYSIAKIRDTGKCEDCENKEICHK